MAERRPTGISALLRAAKRKEWEIDAKAAAKSNAQMHDDMLRGMEELMCLAYASNKTILDEK